MSQFDSVIASMKNEAYPAKKQLLEYTLQLLENMRKRKKKLDPEDRNALLEYAFGEVDGLLAAIPKGADYKEKDQIFECEDQLLGLIMHLCPNSEELPQSVRTKLRILMDLVEKQRYIEVTIDRLFDQNAIGEEEIGSLLDMAAQTRDEYHRGRLYAGLLHYRKEFSKLSDGARAGLAEYLARDLQRYLAMKTLSEDCVNNLELIVDVSRFFPEDGIIDLVARAMKLGYSNVNYYAVKTLLTAGRSVPAHFIRTLAEDLGYAELTYTMLKKKGRPELFPKEYTTPEYLAKSDLVHWLMYPTELGKKPDEIEYLGKITYLFRKNVYYVFKYRSDSDTLGEELRNKWLIGWSSEDGGTFSNFDEYALFELDTIPATLKNIKKKLIG